MHGEASPNVRDPDADGLGVMSLHRGSALILDGALARATAGDALGLVAGGRWGVDPRVFVEGDVPIACEPHAALGNAMLGVGWLPAGDALAGVEVRVAVPTSPRGGAGMAADAALAGPRIADPELYLAHTTSAELVGDWRWRGQTAWLHVEGGVAGWWQPTGYTTVLRATLAGAVHLTAWLDATASFVTRSFVLARDSPDNFEHALLVGAVAHQRRGEIAVRLEVPIGDAHGVLVGLELRGYLFGGYF